MISLLDAIALVSSRPAQSVTGAPVPVQVANTTASPVLNRDLDNPAHRAFSKRVDITFTNGYASGTIAVPAGKRLVITYISANASVAVGAKVLFDVATTLNSQAVEAHLPMIVQGQIFGEDALCSTNPIQLYADPGTNVTISALDTNSADTGGLIVGIYGYLIDLP